MATKSTSTSMLASVLDLFGSLNWNQLSDLVEGKDTLQQGITTAEEVAEVLVAGATIVGVPFAGTAQAFLPTAEKLIDLAEQFGPTALSLATGVQDAVNSHPVGTAGAKPIGIS